MSATHGLAVSFRKRNRLIGLSVAIVCVLGATFASAAGAAPVKESTLTLGDSLAFGYSQQLFNENITFGEPVSAFEHGYANYYQTDHKYKAEGIAEINNGCPGETTDSFIGVGAIGKALDPEGEPSCPYHNVLAASLGFPPGYKFPLHHEYGEPKSQLESAMAVIAENKGKPTEVTRVTLNIGANDELRAIAKCKAEIKAEYEGPEHKSKYGATPEEALKGCIEAHAGELFKHIARNIGRIATAIRKGSLFGPPFVNYTGPLMLIGSYDPYGVVFKKGEPIDGGLYGTGTGKELLPGSTGLTLILNKIERKLITDSGLEAAEEGHEPFEGCFASPYPNFNPGTINGEPRQLKKLTNMANFKEDLGKHYGQENADGPDIHPTPGGYQTMAKVMTAECF